MRKVTSFNLFTLFQKESIDKDLDFHVRARAYEKLVSGKQPLSYSVLRLNCWKQYFQRVNHEGWVFLSVLNSSF